MKKSNQQKKTTKGGLLTSPGNSPTFSKMIRLASFTEMNPRPVIEVGLKGDIIYTNPSVGRIFPELKKQGIKHPYLSNFKKIAKRLKTGSVKEFQREINIKERWFRSFFYYDKKFNSIIVYGTDVTDRKIVEEELLANNETYYNLFNSMDYGYALQDILLDKNKKPIDYRFTEVNSAFERLAKIKKEFIVGKTARQLSQNPQTEESIKLRKAYDRVAITGKPAHFETYNEKLKRYFELYAYKPNPSQIALIFSDITNRKKTDEEKNNFISIMSHELRNPLTPIMANAEFISSILEKEGKKSPLIQESIDVIEKQAKMMASLLNDILDASRMHRNKIQLNKKVINLCEIIKASAKVSLPFINLKQQQLTVLCTPNPIQISADPVRIEQIIVNLINNASKYTQPRGKIDVTTTLKNDTVEIHVKDNGQGMDKLKITRIFDLFSEGGHSFMGIGGLGIGLNIVQNLVRLHQGKVEVVSEGENKGSEFIITLPALAALQEMPNPIEKSSFKKPLRKSSLSKNKEHKILVVDDNTDIRNAVAKILELQGHTIKEAYDGKSAIKTAKSFKPEIAVVDIGLPDMKGYKVAQALRKEIGDSKKIKLIAFTGYGQEKDKKLVKEAGFDHHLVKPIEMSSLLKLINTK